MRPQAKSYPELNSYINNLLGDGQICSGRIFNYLKIFQHALSYSTNKSSRKLLRNFYHLPWFVQWILLLLRKAAVRPKTAKFNSLVFMAENRTIKNKNGDNVSLYFHLILDKLSSDERTILNLGHVKMQSDFHIHEFTKARIFPDDAEVKLLADINEVLRNAARSGHFSTDELRYIKSSFHVFYEEFRFYYSLFKGQNVRRVFLTCHYHKEGLLAALKILGVESIELQHGLIATNDIYYVYPLQYKDVTANALFPDRIGVYGPKWKELLMRGTEFPGKKIDVIGEYFRTADFKISHWEKENIIIVCSQKNLEQDYIRYLDILDEKISLHEGWRALVKLHPLEKNRHQYFNKTYKNIVICDSEVALSELFAKSKIQISIYSTTFFDALGYNVLNLAIQNYGFSKDYAREIAAMGAAIPCEVDDDPIALYLSLSNPYNLPSREEYYSPTVNQEIMQWIRS
jgi:hypothetical protein